MMKISIIAAVFVTSLVAISLARPLVRIASDLPYLIDGVEAEAEPAKKPSELK